MGFVFVSVHRRPLSLVNRSAGHCPIQWSTKIVHRKYKKKPSCTGNFPICLLTDVTLVKSIAMNSFHFVLVLILIWFSLPLCPSPGCWSLICRHATTVAALPLSDISGIMLLLPEQFGHSLPPVVNSLREEIFNNAFLINRRREWWKTWKK